MTGFIVIYNGSEDPAQTGFTLASTKVFATAREAEAYRDSYPASYGAFVVSGAWDLLKFDQQKPAQTQSRGGGTDSGAPIFEISPLSTTPDVPRGTWWNHNGTAMVGYWDLLDEVTELRAAARKNTGQGSP